MKFIELIKKTLVITTITKGPYLTDFVEFKLMNNKTNKNALEHKCKN